MKRLLSFIIIAAMLLCTVSCGKERIETQTDENGVKISESYYTGKELTRKVIYKNGIEYENYVYENSRETERTRYNSDGTVYLKIVREFDKKGREIKMTESGNEGVMASHVYCYDGGYMSRQDDYDGVGSILYSTYYNQSGQKIKVVTYNEIGEEISYTEYAYDTLGNVISAEAKSPDGTLINRIIHEYNSAGNETRTDTYNGDGELVSSLITTYDENGGITDTEFISYIEETENTEEE